MGLKRFYADDIKWTEEDKMENEEEAETFDENYHESYFYEEHEIIQQQPHNMRLSNIVNVSFAKLNPPYSNASLISFSDLRL